MCRVASTTSGTRVVPLAIAAGAHPKAIQSRMGHSSINVTLDRYGHLFPELDEAIAESFGRSLDEATRRRSRVVVSGSFCPRASSMTFR